MAWKFKYDEDRQLLIQSVQGPFTLTDLQELREARRAADIPHPAPRCLNDFRHCSFDFSIAELRAHESGPEARRTGGSRTAVLVTAPLPTAVTILWGRILRDFAEVRTFATPQAAFDWLEVAPREDDLAA